jgi:trk system potassium uptake protein TrkH
MKKTLNRFSNPDRRILLFNKLKSWIDPIIRVLSFVAFGLFIYKIGFDPSIEKFQNVSFMLSLFLLSVGVLMLFKQIFLEKNIKSRRAIIDVVFAGLLIVFSLIRIKFFGEAFSIPMLAFFQKYYLINLGVIILFVMELGKLSLLVNQLKISPSLVFILSFIVLIFLGSVLLLLPESTDSPITFIDALFTATSAVCVTGLIVVDTATVFTPFGQSIIMTLFQIGGLGMMTFTSFFGFFFKGSLSIENSLYLKDYINENNVSAISSTLVKIIMFTVGVEVAGAGLIYFFTDSTLFETKSAHWFFAVFHSVSAFCNAGFSTLSNGLYESGFRELYSMHLVVSICIILGGIGFPVFINYYDYFKRVSIGAFKQIIGLEKYKHTPRIANVNTKLTMYTTAFLLVVGFMSYWFFEQENTLKGLSVYGKIVTAIFGSVTPRTAGFNTVDMTNLAVPTVLIYLILMWIGASPGSTGGGLKVTTFAVAILNTWSVATGRKRVEIFGREIAGETLRKSFAVISLSFLVIGLGVFLVMVFNPELPILEVAFELFSAFATVGLSIGITAKLSTGSKIVVMVVMFLGRVGTLTILVAIARKIGEQHYKYPEESVIVT